MYLSCLVVIRSLRGLLIFIEPFPFPLLYTYYI
jgi:hypothetical protein